MSSINTINCTLTNYVTSSNDYDFNYRECVDVEKYTLRKKKLSKLWHADFSLRVIDTDTLLCPTSWISDVIVNAAQSLLAKKFPDLAGLQDTILGPAMMFSLRAGDFIQIIHTGNAHWVTLSTIGVYQPVIRVYDSIYDSSSTMARLQIASLLHSTSKSIPSGNYECPETGLCFFCWFTINTNFFYEVCNLHHLT